MSFFKFLFSKAFLMQLVLALGVIIALIFVLQWWLGSTTNHDQRIAVPNLDKMTLELVEQELTNANLRYNVIDSANYNPDYPKYAVIEQTPAAGKFVKENRQIYLVLNPSGYRKFQVPDIIGKTKRQAVPTLQATGFKIGAITYVSHMAKDEVRGMFYKGERLTEGTMLEQTATIDLQLGDGKSSRINTAPEGQTNESTTTDDDGA